MLPCIVFGQASADCRSAVPVCADAPISATIEGSGDIDDFDPDVITESGCLEKGSLGSANLENNSAWFVFRAGTDGQVGFDIRALPVNPGDPITADFDFALYGPFDQTLDTNFCTQIGEGAAQPLRCNYESNTTGFTGIGINPVNDQVGAPPSLAGTSNTYDEYINVTAGELYYIFINNYEDNVNGDAESFELNFTGTSVEEDQNTALDCTLRDEFLGLDIIACESDPAIVLSALNSPVGDDIDTVVWSVDYDGDGEIDETFTGTGPFGTELEIPTLSENSGRYFVEITTISGTPPTVIDDILISIYGIPELDEVVIIDDLVNSDQSDPYNIRVEVSGDGDYEYAINGGDFQDNPIFLDVPPGLNTLVINDKNGCGTTQPLEFLVVGYPKFFTPNGDGNNDLWQVKGVEELANPNVFIFDRYGKLLIQLQGNTDGWDGNFIGRPMPESDYWFRLEYDRNQQDVVIARNVRRHFSLVR